MKKVILSSFFLTLSALFPQTQIPIAEDWYWEKYENNPVLTNGAATSWDGTSVQMPCVLKIDNMYHMWYTGHIMGEGGIGYASSPDGKNWTKYEDNPVLEAGGDGSWSGELLTVAPEVYFDGETFHMWYFGVDWWPYRGDIGYASSPDGKNWTKSENNPVLPRGEGVVWDNHFIGYPSVIKEDNELRVYYSGSSTWRGYNFGTATSEDGVTWEKYIDPIVENGPGESMLWQSDVVKSPEGYYYMWYTEGNWGNDDSGFPTLNIRYAYSADGMEWIQTSGHSVIQLGEEGNWDEYLIGYHSVLYDQDDNVYKMWYTGASSNEEHYFIGYAEAPNPLTDISPKDKVPVEYSLSQNYPNPFNPTTTIKYSIPSNVIHKTKDEFIPSGFEGYFVNLIVYDILGREVETLVNEKQKPGNYKVEWNAFDQPSGVYFYRITTDKFSQVKKMLLLK